MDFSFTEEQILLRNSVRKLMSRVATPEYVAKVDRERAYPQELFNAWAEAGLFGLPFPEELGGAGGNGARPSRWSAKRSVAPAPTW